MTETAPAAHLEKALPECPKLKKLKILPLTLCCEPFGKAGTQLPPFLNVAADRIFGKGAEKLIPAVAHREENLRVRRKMRLALLVFFDLRKLPAVYLTESMAQKSACQSGAFAGGWLVLPGLTIPNSHVFTTFMGLNYDLFINWIIALLDEKSIPKLLEALKTLLSQGKQCLEIRLYDNLKTI